jgi:hypothetical protein
MQLFELNEIFSIINKSNNDYDLFLETGTLIGDTINNVKSEFKELVSIEIAENLYVISKERFINENNIEIILGDSVIEIPKLIDRFDDKHIVFFLDGHYSAGTTGKGNKDVPLIEELIIIEEKYINDGLIIIDDADLFDFVDSQVSWMGINEKNILNALKNRINNYFYMSDVRSNKKRLIILLNQKYN